jgi:hypothetical protein
MTCKLPSPFLMVTIPRGRVSESVTKAELTHGVTTGIRWGALGRDMVPVFEEMSARLERNMTLEQWAALDPMERALVVAQRRIDNAIRNIQTEAEIRAAKKKQRK